MHCPKGVSLGSQPPLKPPARPWTYIPRARFCVRITLGRSRGGRIPCSCPQEILAENVAVGWWSFVAAPYVADESASTKVCATPCSRRNVDSGVSVSRAALRGRRRAWAASAFFAAASAALACYMMTY